MDEVTQAKQALLQLAREQDVRQKETMKSLKSSLGLGALVLGGAVIGGRLLLGGGRGRSGGGSGGGGKIMKLFVLGRLAMTFGPAILQGIQRARTAYEIHKASTTAASTRTPSRPPITTIRPTAEVLR